MMVDGERGGVRSVVVLTPLSWALVEPGKDKLFYTATLLIFYFLFFLVPSFSSCLEKKVSSIILSLIFYFLFHFLYSYDFFKKYKYKRDKKTK